MTALDRLMKRHRLIRLEPCAAVTNAFGVFRERTRGMREVAWELKAWNPAGVGEAFEQYGFDCYTQGLMDGVRVATTNPQFAAELRAGEESNHV